LLLLVEINLASSIEFGLVWYGLVFVSFHLSFCVDLFSWLGVQGGHSYEPIHWLFDVGNFLALSLTFPWILVSCSSVYTDTFKGKFSLITLWSKVWLLSV